MNKTIVIINKPANTKVSYTPSKRFWAFYPATLKQEVVNTILSRNRAGESVMSVCKDLSETYARSPSTLANWYRELT